VSHSPKMASDASSGGDTESDRLWSLSAMLYDASSAAWNDRAQCTDESERVALAERWDDYANAADYVSHVLRARRTTHE